MKRGIGADGFLLDLRRAMRTVWASPRFTLTAWLVLALGIGLNLTLFEIARATALDPPRVKEPGTLVRFERISGGRGLSHSWSVPYSTVQTIRRSGALAAVLTQALTDGTAWGRLADEQVRAAYVSANWFSELGYGAAGGRVFSEEIEDFPDAAPAVVVSHDFWTSRLQQDPAVIGKTVWINKRPATLVGVAPKGFPGLGLADTEIWLPINQFEYFVPGSEFQARGAAEMYGRLRQGSSLAATMENLRAVLAAVAGDGAWLEPYSGDERFEPPAQRQRNRRTVMLAACLSLLILAIACANLSSLLLSRGLGRVREFGIRLALGASRPRLIREILAESVVLAVPGAAAGLVLGWWAADLFAVWAGLPRHLHFTPDWTTIMAAFGAAAFAALAVGWLPAWKFSRGDLISVMKDGGEQASASAGRTRLRQTLVAAQAGGSCVLLVVAGLTARGLVRVSTPPGFEVDRIAILEAPLALAGITGDGARLYWNQVKKAIARHPEAESVALVSMAPLGKDIAEATYRGAAGVRVTSLQVEPDFFSLMRIPILGGRPFAVSDDPRKTVIVSRRLAMEMYGTVHLVGQGFPKGYQAQTIVGIAGDASLIRYRAPDVAEIYRPADMQEPGLLLLALAKSDPERLLAPMRRAAVLADDRIVPRTRLMRGDLDQKLRVPRLVASIAVATALLALALTCVGLFGVVSYSVRLHSKQFGIRLALGAAPRSIFVLLLRQSGLPPLAGVVIGLCAAIPAGRLIEARLEYLRAIDVPVYAASVLALVLTGCATSVAPALRVLRSNPLDFLRHE